MERPLCVLRDRSWVSGLPRHDQFANVRPGGSCGPVAGALGVGTVDPSGVGAAGAAVAAGVLPGRGLCSDPGSPKLVTFRCRSNKGLTTDIWPLSQASSAYGARVGAFASISAVCAWSDMP